MTRKAKLVTVVALVVLLFAGSAWAKDAIAATITNATGTPLIINNGNANANGTYAVGTIQLWYTVVAYQFPSTDNFASFDLDWTNLSGYASGGTTDYAKGITLNVEQIGGTDLVLTPTPGTFSIPVAGLNGTSVVQIGIPISIATDPARNFDGAELVGNLRLSTTPAGAKLDTVTNVQVHIKLVHPSQCVKVYDFVTQEDFTAMPSALNVQLKNGAVNSSQPGQFSDNVMIANICASAESFDLGIGPDNAWDMQAANAVQTYSTTDVLDAASFNIAAFGTSTPQGKQLCLENVTIAPNSTFLATVHTGIQKGLLASALPGDGTFDYSATLYATPNNACSGGLFGLAAPNPAAGTLPFTTTTIGSAAKK